LRRGAGLSLQIARRSVFTVGCMDFGTLEGPATTIFDYSFSVHALNPARAADMR
jgi:hypothetical protein